MNYIKVSRSRSRLVLGMVILLFSFIRVGKANEMTVIIDDQGVPMVYVPGDTFQMGASMDEAVAVCTALAPDDYKGASQTCSQRAFEEFSLISPAQTVEVESFYIDQYEVSLEITWIVSITMYVQPIS